MIQAQKLTPEQALKKLQHYCAYSERCHSQVVDKLYGYGIWQKDHDAIIASLIEDDYLNEERFAQAFARGHFRLKKWGRVKIRQELQFKKLSPYCIRSAMQEIDDQEYESVLQQLFNQKWESLKGEKNRFIKMKKTQRFLIQKGFETDLIQDLFKKV